LRGKDWWYTVENKRLDYVKVAEVGELTEKLEDLTIKDDKGIEKKVRVNIDKNKLFLKDEASAISFICQSLNDDDEALTDEHDTAYDLWVHLKSKYTKINAVTANIYTVLAII
jgi:NTP pyrophosphatase (non-canonical NTP hydrolase)